MIRGMPKEYIKNKNKEVKKLQVSKAIWNKPYLQLEMTKNRLGKLRVRLRERGRPT